jgi:hypothetical protein
MFCAMRSTEKRREILSDESLLAEEQNNYIVFYLIELKIIMKTL